MNLSNHKKCIIFAVEQGYKCTKDGSIVGTRGQKLKLNIKTTGYYSFSIRKDGIVYRILVHQFVAYCKYGDKFLTSECVRHIDGDPLNNNWDNICIGTHSDNMMDIPQEIRQKNAEYASSFVTRHNHDKIKKYYEENDVSYKDLMKKFNISSKGTVSYIINK